MKPLTTEQAAQIKGAQLANALRKIKEGKSVTPSEQKLINEASRGPVKYYDTIAAAAGALRVSQALLKKMKRAGCKSFRHGRVYIDDEFMATLKAFQDGKSGEPDTKEKLEIRRLLAQCERIEFQLSVDRREFISSEEVATSIRQMAEGQKAVLLANEDEWPPKLAGLSAPAIKVQLKILTDEFCSRMREMAVNFGTVLKEPANESSVAGVS